MAAVVQGMKSLTRDDVPDMYDPALLEMSLEICADAINVRGSRRERGDGQALGAVKCDC